MTWGAGSCGSARSRATLRCLLPCGVPLIAPVNSSRLFGQPQSFVTAVSHLNSDCLLPLLDSTVFGDACVRFACCLSTAPPMRAQCKRSYALLAPSLHTRLCRALHVSQLPSAAVQPGRPCAQPCGLTVGALPDCAPPPRRSSRAAG